MPTFSGHGGVKIVTRREKGSFKSLPLAAVSMKFTSFTHREQESLGEKLHLVLKGTFPLMLLAMLGRWLSQRLWLQLETFPPCMLCNRIANPIVNITCSWACHPRKPVPIRIVDTELDWPNRQPDLENRVNFF